MATQTHPSQRKIRWSAPAPTQPSCPQALQATLRKACPTSVRIEATDRDGPERLIRCCARPPFALDRLHLVGGRSDQILYILPKPDPAGRTALPLSALEFLDRLATILPPPRIHRHRYHGVFAPNAPLRPLVTERAQKDNALLVQLPGPPPFLSRHPPRPRLPSQRGYRRGHRIPPPPGHPGGPLFWLGSMKSSR